MSLIRGRWFNTWNLQQTFDKQKRDSPVQGFDLAHQIARLRHGRKLSDSECLLIVKSLSEQAQTDEQIISVSLASSCERPL